MFPTGGNRGTGPPPTSLKFAHPLNLEEFPLSRLPPSHQIFIPSTTKQQFSSYNPKEIAFLAVVIDPAPFLFYFHSFWTHRSC